MQTSTAMKALVESIVKPLAAHPDAIKVTTSEKDGKTVCQLLVHQEDAGKIIGKNGRIAKAIRSVMYVKAGPAKKIYLDIKQWEGIE